MNYDVLKIDLLRIIGCIAEYTTESDISVPCDILHDNLTRNTLSIDVLEHCCATISKWYTNNLSKINSNSFVHNKEVHRKNLEQIARIVSDIQENREEYSELCKNLIRNEKEPVISGRDIFIVHGHDVGLKIEVARFLEKLNFNPIILHEYANEGQTIIEKIERYTNVQYGMVLYTPCDEGRTLTDDQGHALTDKDKEELKFRARQNVVFEHGYLIGKLGRNRVCALVKDSVEKPNDISGVLYIPYKEERWKLDIAKELRAAGYSFDFNQLL